MYNAPDLHTYALTVTTATVLGYLIPSPWERLLEKLAATTLLKGVFQMAFQFNYLKAMSALAVIGTGIIKEMQIMANPNLTHEQKVHELAQLVADDAPQVLPVLNTPPEFVALLSNEAADEKAIELGEVAVTLVKGLLHHQQPAAASPQ